MTDLLAEFHRQQEEKQRKLQHHVATEMNLDPDRSARVWGVSAATGIPNDMVDADLDNLEGLLDSKEYRFEDYTDKENGSPVFNKMALEDPYNYAVMKRDRLSMTMIERALTPIVLGNMSGWATVEMSEIADRKIKGTSLFGDEDRAKRINDLLEGGSFGAENMFSKALVYTAQQVPIQAWLVGESVDEIAIGAMAYGSTAAAINAVPGAGQIGFGASLAMGAGHGFIAGRTEAAFRLERGLAYMEFLDLGFDEPDALLFANGVGGVNAALESVGLGALTKRIPGFRAFQRDVVGDTLATIFAKPTMRHAVTRLSLQYGEGMATEVLTEVMQESTLMAAREHLKAGARDAGDTRPELAPMEPEEFWDTVREIAVHTLYGTSIIGGMGPVMNFRADAKRARAAQEQQAMWATLAEGATESKTRNDAPSLWTAFVKRIQEKGPLKEVRVDARGWREYWQSQNVDPEEVALQFGIDLKEAEATDVDIILPFNTYLESIAPTEHHVGLMEHFRARPEEMTMRESEQWFKDKDEHIAKLEAVLADEFDMTTNDEIAKDLAPQLEAVGYNKQAAAKQAKLTAVIFTTLGARSKKDPMQLYKDRIGGIHRQIPEALAGQDIDMDMDPILDAIRNKRFPKQREIYGQSLFDMIREVGNVQDQGGELSARDLGRLAPGMISKTGLTIDGIAEIAFDRGFITAHDQGLLMEAIDKEAAGDLQFGRESKIDTDLQELLGQLETAANFLEEEKIDLNEMTNAQVRKYLKGVKTLQQSSDNDLEKWSDMVVLLAAQEDRLARERSENEKDNRGSYDSYETMIAKAEALMPRLSHTQDFKDVTFTDKFVDSKGKSGTVNVSAQETFDAAVTRRNLLNRLMDCVNG